MSEDIKAALKGKRSTAKASVTKAISHIRGLMLSNDVESVILYVDGAFADKLSVMDEAHNEYHRVLVDDQDVLESDEYFKLYSDTVNAIRREVDVFIRDNQSTMMYMRPEDSVSQVTSKSSIVEAKADAAAKIAELTAEADALNESLDLEYSQMLLNQRQKSLEIKKKLAAAKAREQVYSESMSDHGSITGRKPTKVTSDEADFGTSTPVVSKALSDVGKRLSWGGCTTIPPHPSSATSSPPTKSQAATHTTPSSSAHGSSPSIPAGSFHNPLTSDQSLLMMSSLIETMTLPKSELIPFDGDPKAYWSFIRSFKNNVDKSSVSPADKLARLVQYCKGEAKRLLQCCLPKEPSEGYELALNLLEERYGDPHRISQEFIKQLSTHAKVTSPTELQAFADELRLCKETLGEFGYMQEINNLSYLHTLISKLPSDLNKAWLKVNYDIKLQKRVPNIEDVIAFITRKAKEQTDVVFGDLVYGNKDSKHQNSQKHNRRVRSVHATQVNQGQPSTGSRSKCLKCGGDHFLAGCRAFKAMSVLDRFNLVKEKHACINCFRPGHFGRECRKEYRCDVNDCGQKHNRMLHRVGQTSSTPAVVTPASSTNPTVTTSVPSVGSHAVSAGSGVLLPILPVCIKYADRRLITNAVLDTAANQSFCTERVAQMLGAEIQPFETDMDTMYGKTRISCGQVNIEVSSVDNDTAYEMKNVITRPSLNMNAPTEVSKVVEKWEHLQAIQDELPSIIGDVEILIGLDMPDLIAPSRVITGPAGSPFAAKTALGWTLNGPTCEGPTNKQCFFTRVSSPLEDQVKRFWELENPDINQPMSISDRKAVDEWESSVSLSNGHYSLNIPLKDRSSVKLPNNYAYTKHRLHQLEKKFRADSDYRVKYETNIKTLLQKGYAEPAPISSTNPIWYIPHHGVFKRNSSKLRVVFDCSAQFNGQALNQIVHQGPDYTNKLLGVLLRFRQHQIAFKADVEAMFNQVVVNEQDRDLLRFLWPNPADPHNPLVYRMTRHLFGGIWSPSVANFTLRKCAEDNSHLYEENVTSTILHNFYVDDCLKSVREVSEAVQLVHDVVELLNRGGFKLTKFSSNDSTVLGSIPEELRAPDTTLSLELGEAAVSERALGVYWNLEEDTFQVETNVPDKAKTKRGILSASSSIYDPLGWVSPYTLKAKMLFQLVCRRGLEWDQEISQDEQRQWNAWVRDLQILKSYQIPRCLIPGNTSDIQLHIFSDASELAYGAVAYLRVPLEDEVGVNLVMAKSKVAPLKFQTIPRLELQAAVEAANMKRLIEKEIDLPLTCHMWTDSMIVIWYLKKAEEKRYQTFVSNRVSKILEVTQATDWNYVHTKENPADLASRGMSAAEMLESRLWSCGPEFLKKPPGEWPQSEVLTRPEGAEIKKEIQVYATITEQPDKENPINKLMSHYSSYFKLQKAVAHLVKVKDYLLKRLVNMKETLTIDQLNMSDQLIIKHSQKSLTAEQMKTLNPVVRDGVYTVGGRVQSQSQPLIILHGASRLAPLVLSDSHVKTGHLGVEATLAHTRSRFWVIAGRRMVKAICKRCTICRRVKQAPMNQMMAPLPVDRTTPAPPFTSTGVDYFGPFYVKRARSEVKRYGCLFTCLVSRAIHLEMSHTLEADSFINALQRFIARRGKPKIIRSDQGSNFVGAENEMIASLEQSNKVKGYLLSHGIQWMYNPPHASHFGGVWERQIRTVRQVLKSVSGTQRLDDETLCTLFTVVENLVNSRPLTKLSDNPDDLNPLTPNHVLLMNQDSVDIPGVYVKQDLYLAKRWRQVQVLSDIFWKRWIKQYLPNLQTRQKWMKPQRNLQINDLVLMVDENTPRGQWPLGRVLEVKVSSDGLVRSATIKAKNGVYDRPIDKLVMVLSDEAMESQDPQ